MYNMKSVGRVCRDFRMGLGLPLTAVSAATGYSPQNVCHFEQGRNDNTTIFLWYIAHGLDIDIVIKGVLSDAET